MRKLETIIIVLTIVVAVVFMWLGVLTGKEIVKEEAILHNAAHYTVNPTNGVTTFVWKGMP